MQAVNAKSNRGGGGGGAGGAGEGECAWACPHAGQLWHARTHIMHQMPSSFSCYSYSNTSNMHSKLDQVLHGLKQSACQPCACTVCRDRQLISHDTRQTVHMSVRRVS